LVDFPKVAYEVRFADDVKRHLRALTITERSAALDAIERQLLHEPLVETRHRKPLRPNPIAPWELRVGKLRVFYEVVFGEPGVVRILAVGRKERNVLQVAGREMRL
jgi:mRNA-degrading endonuclease RelE of RelBE toxin-antitoxin system